MDLVLDIVEIQDDIMFVTGYVAKALSVGDSLKALSVYQPAKKKKHNPKKLSSLKVDLKVETILVEGEPIEMISADNTAQVALTGNTDILLSLLKDHQWHESNGRYFLPRKETRLITLSGA